MIARCEAGVSRYSFVVVTSAKRSGVRRTNCFCLTSVEYRLLGLLVCQSGGVSFIPVLRRVVEDGPRAHEVEVILEEQSHEDGVREGYQAAQDDPGEGVSPRRLDDGRRQVAQRQEAHPAEGSRMEVGGVPFADVRRGHDRRTGLHREERLLEAGGDQPGDLAVATHCSPLADNERSNSNGTANSTNASGSAAGKSYSLEHRIRRASTSERRHLVARRSYRELFGCRGSVFAAAECVDQKIMDSQLRAEPAGVERA